MNERSLAIVLIAAGLVLGLLSALADPLGVGGESGFGWKQIVGVAAGGVLLAAGALLWARSAAAASRRT
jgi:hypothetical protein